MTNCQLPHRCRVFVSSSWIITIVRTLWQSSLRQIHISTQGHPTCTVQLKAKHPRACAGRAARRGLRAHEGQMVLSFCCNTTSKTWHRVFSTILWSVRRDIMSTSGGATSVGPSLVFRAEICAVCTPFVPVARERLLGVPSSMVASAVWCFLVKFIQVPFFCCPTVLLVSSLVDNGLATKGSNFSDLVCHGDSSCIDGLMDGCKGYRGLFGCTARSKLHECFVKKLSPHVH